MENIVFIRNHYLVIRLISFLNNFWRINGLGYKMCSSISSDFKCNVIQQLIDIPKKHDKTYKIDLTSF